MIEEMPTQTRCSKGLGGLQRSSPNMVVWLADWQEVFILIDVFLCDCVSFCGDLHYEQFALSLLHSVYVWFVDIGVQLQWALEWYSRFIITFAELQIMARDVRVKNTP